MEKLGEFLGWLTGLFFAAALLTYLVKRIHKRWIAALPRESASRLAYQKLMEFVVKYHRYFGIAAAAAAGVHLLVQCLWEFPSVTGLLAAALLLLTAVLGAVMLYGHQSKLLKPHRITAAAGVLLVLIHLLLKR